MGRRRSLTHFLSGTAERERTIYPGDPPDTPRTYTARLFACGDESSFESGTVRREHVTCQRCSTALWGDDARATGLVVERVKLRRYSGWRSAYGVRDPGATEPFVYLVFPNGFGGRWQLAPVLLDSEDGVGHEGLKGPGRYSEHAFPSQEAALAVLPTLRAEEPESYRSRTTRERDRAARRMAADQRNREDEERRLQRVEEGAEIIRTLKSLRTRLAHKLTNAETAALEDAISKLPGAFPRGVRERVAETEVAHG